jgi:hypothetical protein
MLNEENQSKLTEAKISSIPLKAISVLQKAPFKRGYCCKSGCRHCPYGFDKKRYPEKIIQYEIDHITTKHHE